jgi:hypothetical protein
VIYGEVCSGKPFRFFLLGRVRIFCAQNRENRCVWVVWVGGKYLV